MISPPEVTSAQSTAGTAATTLTGLLAVASLGLFLTAHAQSVSNATLVVDDLMWSLAASSEPVLWADAEEFCDTLEAAGHSDWRLPSLAELEGLHDPSTASGLPPGLPFPDCCAWSSDSLVEIPADRKGNLPDPVNSPDKYYWGLVFAGGVRYYSNLGYPDGSALCVRNLSGG